MLGFISAKLKGRFSRDRKYYLLVNRIFGIYPDNIELYKLALIHRSASVFLDDGTQVNNERLEFLGDAILEAVVSDYLFIEFPDKNEGFLTQIRSKIVSRESLNSIAVKIGLSDYVIVQNSNRHLQKHLFGDALEAMVGAIYLDKGYNCVNRLVINNILATNLDLDDMVENETDFKSRIIEWCQKHKREIRFDTVPSTGIREHSPAFISTVYIGSLSAGRGEGASKKQAEQTASCVALEFVRHGIGGDAGENTPSENETTLQA